MDLCSPLGIKLNLTTNGTFPGRGARDWADQIVPVASDIKVSWNGATPGTQERIMVGSRFQEKLENLRQLVAVRDAHARKNGARCTITLQMTFLELNVEELPELVRLAAGLGVDRLKGHHVWTHFPELEAMSMRRDEGAIRRWNRIVHAAEQAVEEHRLPGGRRIVLANIFPLAKSAADDLAPGGACPFLGAEAWVSAEGRFDPCCAPDELRRTLGDFGDLHHQSLLEIWNGEAYRFLVQSYRTRALCLGCNMRRPVEGEP